MVAVIYNKTAFAAAPSNIPVILTLEQEIQADGGITTNLLNSGSNPANGKSTRWVRFDPPNEQLQIEFVSTLSGAEQTALDAVVAAHTGGAATISTLQQFLQGDNSLPNNVVLTWDGTKLALLAVSDLGGPTPNYIEDLVLLYTGISSVQIGVGKATDTTGATTIELASAKPLDINVTGAGGIDQGFPVSGQSWAVYVIVDSAGQLTSDVVASLNFTSPSVLPAGYDLYRRVGSFILDSFGGVMQFVQYGRYAQRTVEWQTDRSTFLRVVSSGGSDTWTTVVCTSQCPPSAHEVDLVVQSNDGAIVVLRPYLNLESTGTREIGPNSISNVRLRTHQQRIQYKNSTTSPQTTIDVMGYVEEL